MKIITPLNYVSKREFKEITNKPSETVPNQSYTLRELLTNFTVDSRPKIEREPIYGGQIDDPNLMYAFSNELEQQQYRQESLDALKAQIQAEMQKPQEPELLLTTEQNEE